jgi:hypothetical protein
VASIKIMSLERPPDNFSKAADNAHALKAVAHGLFKFSISNLEQMFQHEEMRILFKIFLKIWFN